MDECLVEKCLVNLTKHWKGEITMTSVDIFNISYWTWTALIVIFGIPLCLGILHYEWFEGDPQKRSLANRMMSGLVISQCLAGVAMHLFTGLMR